jgi:hypothetical protein
VTQVTPFANKYTTHHSDFRNSTTPLSMSKLQKCRASICCGFLVVKEQIMRKSCAQKIAFANEPYCSV